MFKVNVYLTHPQSPGVSELSAHSLIVYIVHIFWTSCGLWNQRVDIDCDRLSRQSLGKDFKAHQVPAAAKGYNRIQSE